MKNRFLLLALTTSMVFLYEKSLTSDAFAWMDDVATTTITTESETVAQKILTAAKNNDLETIQQLHADKQLFNAYADNGTYALDYILRHKNAAAFVCFLESMSDNDIMRYEKDKFFFNAKKNSHITTESNVRVFLTTAFQTKKTISLFFEKFFKNSHKAERFQWSIYEFLFELIGKLNVDLLQHSLTLTPKHNKYFTSQLHSKLNDRLQDLLENQEEHVLTAFLQCLKDSNVHKEVLNTYEPHSIRYPALNKVLWCNLDFETTKKITTLLISHGAEIFVPEDLAHAENSTVYTAFTKNKPDIFTLFLQIAKQQGILAQAYGACLVALTMGVDQSKKMQLLLKHYINPLETAIPVQSLIRTLVNANFSIKHGKSLVILLASYGLFDYRITCYLNLNLPHLQSTMNDIIASHSITDKILGSTTTQQHDTFHATLPEEMRRYMALLFMQYNQPTRPVDMQKAIAQFHKYCDIFCWKNNETQNLKQHLIKVLPEHLKQAVIRQLYFPNQLNQNHYPCDVTFKFQYEEKP